VTVTGLDHVQLAMPPGGEPEARAFYEGVLGIPEVAKPARLAARGGCWFESGALRVHLGVEEGFRPARKAHPGLAVAGMAAMAERLVAAGVAVQDEGVHDGMHQVYVEDPFGNRLELVERVG
jgi:catechol 2,3-dioxygenase-like lactoylglutathione lyase family enzyme